MTLDYDNERTLAPLTVLQLGCRVLKIKYGSGLKSWLTTVKERFRFRKASLCL